MRDGVLGAMRANTLEKRMAMTRNRNTFQFVKGFFGPETQPRSAKHLLKALAGYSCDKQEKRQVGVISLPQA